MTRTKASTGPGKGSRSLRSLAQRDAYISILQVAEKLQRQVVELLKPADLTLAQYNVLRALRGAGSGGLACGEVAGKLIRHDPDMTRLIDRLDRRGLTERNRDARDRRVVRTRITSKGLAVLAELDDPIDVLHERQFGHIGDEHLARLTALLQESHARIE